LLLFFFFFFFFFFLFFWSLSSLGRVALFACALTLGRVAKATSLRREEGVLPPAREYWTLLLAALGRGAFPKSELSLRRAAWRLAVVRVARAFPLGWGQFSVCNILHTIENNSNQIVNLC
jgi:hypothetical protein